VYGSRLHLENLLTSSGLNRLKFAMAYGVLCRQLFLVEVTITSHREVRFGCQKRNPLPVHLTLTPFVKQ
jgi:hypothetical protein